MTTPTSISSEIQSLEPSAIIELFELDATNLGSDIFRFHAGTNSLKTNVIWQGETYTRYPVEASGFEVSSNGQLPRPHLRASNVLGSITSLLLSYGDLLGAKVTRKRTLAKYLDAANFSGSVNPTADDTAAFEDDVFFIDRKTSEDRSFVEFELAAAIDLQGVQLPFRQIIQNICPWKYRGPECGYTGTTYFDVLDNPVTSPALDVCGKRLASCKLRFGATNPLPIGSYPGAGLVR